jgi:2'-5' RNA ligase
MSDGAAMSSAESSTKPDVTALTVFAPAADSLVAPLRMKRDPVAADGVRAHITILYPFMHPDAMNGAVQERLRRLFAVHSRFDYAFTGIGRFPNGIYLAPEPVQPFITLTEVVMKAFPDYPPYEGHFPAIVPHLTVAQCEDSQKLSEIERDFAIQAATALPLPASVSHVWLMERRNGRWREHTTFPLG